MEATELATQEVELRSRLVEVKRRKVGWIQQHKIYFFQPYCEEQRGFLASKAIVRMLIGPNRIGKTTAGAVLDIAYWLGFFPWLLPDDLKVLPIEELLAQYDYLPKECLTPFHPPAKGVIVVSDWDVADDIWTVGAGDSAGKLKQYIPVGAVERIEKNNMGNICCYHLKRFGSQLILDTQKSFINDPQSFEGKQHDWAHWDEPPHRAMRVAVARGLADRGGHEAFTLTPLREPWIKNEIVDKAPASKGKIEVFSMCENKNPHISREGWDDYASKLNIDEYKARVQGMWVHLEGLVYKEFIPKMAKEGGHLVEPLDPKWIYENCVVDVALDPHPRQPHAVLFMATAKDKRRFLFDELFSDTYLSDLCKFWKAKESYHAVDAEGKGFKTTLPILNRIADLLAFDEDPEDGRKWADAFQDEGIILDKASKRKDAGITAVRQAFKERTLFVCTNCVRVIFEIQNYLWDEWKYNQDRNQKEKPKDKDDHMMENMYRLILLETQYIDVRKPSRAFKVRDLAEV